jgi:hypothetical protein
VCALTSPPRRPRRVPFIHHRPHALQANAHAAQVPQSEAHAAHAARSLPPARSAADPSALCQSRIEDEEDVLQVARLPDFDESLSQVRAPPSLLSRLLPTAAQQSSELLISMLTVPYIRIPLVRRACGSRRAPVCALRAGGRTGLGAELLLRARTHPRSRKEVHAMCAWSSGSPRVTHCLTLHCACSAGGRRLVRARGLATVGRGRGRDQIRSHAVARSPQCVAAPPAETRMRAVSSRRTRALKTRRVACC